MNALCIVFTMVKAHAKKFYQNNRKTKILHDVKTRVFDIDYSDLELEKNAQHSCHIFHSCAKVEVM